VWVDRKRFTLSVQSGGLLLLRMRTVVLTSHHNRAIFDSTICHVLIAFLYTNAHIHLNHFNDHLTGTAPLHCISISFRNVYFVRTDKNFHFMFNVIPERRPRISHLIPYLPICRPMFDSISVIFTFYTCILGLY